MKVQSTIGKWQKIEQNHGKHIEIPEPMQDPRSPTKKNTEDDDLTGWKVKVSRSKRLRPMKMKPKQQTSSDVNIIEPVRRSADINAIQKSEWEPIKMHVDSGAEDTVAPIEAMPGIEPDTTNASEEGFRVADGTVIPNAGVKDGIIATQEWSTLKGIAFQVAPVNKALLSVSRMVDSGHRVVFDTEWSYIEDRKTGERTTLVRENGLYALRAWVRSRNKGTPPPKPSDPAPKSQPFTRPGR